MRNIMFAVELFSIYICAASCLIDRPSNREKSKSPVNKQTDLASSLEEAKANQNTDTHVKESEKLNKLLNPVASDKVEQEPSDLDTQWEVNFKLLSLTACRKIAGELTQLDKNRLGINQKVNGKDKPLQQIQQEIKSRCKHYPDQVNPVVRSHCNPKAKSAVNKAIPLVKAPQSQGNSRSA